MTKDEATIKQKIKDIDGILDLVDEPTYISYLVTTRRTLEWVIE